MDKPIRVEIRERSSEFWYDKQGERRPSYVAAVAGNPEYWGTGRGPMEALGDMILSHPEVFGLEIDNIAPNEGGQS